MESEVPASRIVRHDTTSSVRPLPWEDNTAGEGDQNGQPALMGNDNRYPDKERFETLRNELLIENDDGFREVSRMPPREGRQRVRIAQTRKFWAGFERMALYWDTSLDNYFERPATPEPQPEDKGDKMQTDDENTQTSERNPSMDIDQPAQTNGNGTNDDPGSRTPVERYTGRRVGAGHEMPEDAREETVRAFVEMAAWPFGCQVSIPTIPPRLAVKTLLFPVRMTFETGRSPKDRTQARSGVLEGPVFVGQCRSETAFRTPEENPGSGIGDAGDVFREVGAMLLAAQERAREGVTDVRPGEGQWWTTAPRWGGGTSEGPEGEHHTEEDSNSNHEKEKPHKRSKYDHPFLALRRPRRMSNADRWKAVQPGPSLWEKRMRYMQIGKTVGSLYDDVRPSTPASEEDYLTPNRSTWYPQSITTSPSCTYASTVDISKS